MKQFIAVSLAHMVLGTEAHDMSIQSLCNLAFNALKCSATDEQDVLGINCNHLLLGMLASSLGRDVDYRPLEQLQQSLLYTLAAHVTRDAGVITLAGNLVNLVDEHDAALGLSDIVVTGSQQPRQQALNVLSHISGLGQHRGIDNGKGHFQHLGYRLGEQRLARARRPDNDDIALLDVNIIIAALVQALIVVIDRYRQVTLGGFLSDDILVEIGLDFFGLRQGVHVEVGQTRCAYFIEILVREFYSALGTLIADAAVHAGEQ